MRKIIIGLALVTLLTLVGCRSIYGALTHLPLLSVPGYTIGGKWIDGKVLSIYTDNGRYDGKARWDNFTANLQRVQNFVDIHFFNYDIRDPYVGAPFFGDPH